jgi:UPF0755 protein
MIDLHKKFRLLAKLLLVGFVVFAGLLGYRVFYPHQIPNNSYQLVVDMNENVSGIANDLSAHGIIKDKFLFRGLLRLLGRDRKVAAGLYFLKNSMSTWDIVFRITNGKPDQISVTFIDGWSLEQIRSYVNGLSNIQHLTSGFSDEDLKTSLKIDLPSLEGVFYPSTYFIAPNQTDLEIYQQAYRLMQKKLTELYSKRSAVSIYSNPYQMLTMASLIQKETGKKEDMFLVSTVFNNRIRKGMKLQDDPAVFYGLRKQKTVSRKDFQLDTPYNTYTRFGLPPTPICTPSYNALVAASQPLDKPDLLFFLAIGSGKTKFSNTYDEHKSAVNKYLKKVE